MAEKKDVLLTNLMIKEQHCDSFCKYCYHNKVNDGALKKTNQYKYDGDLKANVDKILEFSTTNFNCPIVKICGGEIFLMEDLKEFVGELLKKYDYVLIQTNGKHLNDETLKWIIDYKRVLLQISIDGHLLEMNRFRFDTQAILDKLLYAISVLKKADIYVELTTVLNKLNTRRYKEFLEFLDNMPKGKKNNVLKCTPILLIDDTGEFKPSEEDIKCLEELTKPNKYSHILPPMAYMQNLYKLMNGETLVYQCFNPLISANYEDSGDVKGCTNVLPESVLNVGNVLIDDHEEILNNFGNTKFQNLLMKTKQRIPLCKKCYNFCSIYNLYLNDTISLEELTTNNYMFELEEVKAMLEKLKLIVDEYK